MRISWSRCAISCWVVAVGACCAAAASATESSDKPQWPKGLECRKPEWRKELLARGGGTDESEQAVAAALKWLAEHQMQDGSWSFDLAASPSCQGKCRDSGKPQSGQIAATGLALLAFLGTGNSHKEGDYKQTVDVGLKFIKAKLKRDRRGGGALNVDGGKMYAHGIAAQALCDAHALTGDESLQGPAQATLDFIAYAQDPVGGGWRYLPRQPGDTSVFGWQAEALHLGRVAGLKVDDATLQRADQFLTRVQWGGGSHFGYTNAGQGEATTAIGLLSRLHFGRPINDPALVRGMDWLGLKGPSRANFYFNYFATRVLFERGGDTWKKWNWVMRDQLIRSQSREGHETGSWYIDGPTNDQGGRLYATALATLILEVYYRYPPVGWKEQ